MGRYNMMVMKAAIIMVLAAIIAASTVLPQTVAAHRGYDNHEHISGSVRDNSDASSQRLNCDDRNVCQEVNTVINGNGNTVFVNTNGNSGNVKGDFLGAETGDGGGGY